MKLEEAQGHLPKLAGMGVGHSNYYTPTGRWVCNNCMDYCYEEYRHVDYFSSGC